MFTSLMYRKVDSTIHTVGTKCLQQTVVEEYMALITLKIFDPPLNSNENCYANPIKFFDPCLFITKNSIH